MVAQLYNTLPCLLKAWCSSPAADVVTWVRKHQKVASEAISHTTVVEHLPHHPKADDSSTDAAAGICKRKYQKMILRPSTVARWYNTYLIFLRPSVRVQPPHQAPWGEK